MPNAQDSGEQRPSVFLSYRRLDDETPPGERRGAMGFVRHLQDQLRYELTRELGLPQDVLWLDRNRIHTADDFASVVADAIKQCDIFLAVVSRNYVQGTFCTAEVQAFSQRVQEMQRDAQARRIFRADKQEVDDASLPLPLRGLEPVRFYDKAPEGTTLEYYYRGRVTQRTAYYEAIHELAQSIYNRFRELGVCGCEPTYNPMRRKLAKNDRNVYVSVPAADTRDAYHTLVQELWARGFNVLPNLHPKSQLRAADDTPPVGYLPNEGPDALAEVRKALAVCEASIHLLGDRQGFTPDGLTIGVVAMQLAEAREELRRRADFRRIIWAPKLVAGTPERTTARDPLEVLARFDQFSDLDEIESDTAARFNDFVLQRLIESRATPISLAAAARPKASLFVAYLPVDEKLALATVKRLKDAGAGQIFFGVLDPQVAPAALDRQSALMNRADHVVFCWGAAEDIDIVNALDLPQFQAWRRQRPKGRICLFACDPDKQIQSTACEAGTFAQADLVINAVHGDLATSCSELFRIP